MIMIIIELLPAAAALQALLYITYCCDPCPVAPCRNIGFIRVRRGLRKSYIEARDKLRSFCGGVHESAGCCCFVRKDFGMVLLSPECLVELN